MDFSNVGKSKHQKDEQDKYLVTWVAHFSPVRVSIAMEIGDSVYVGLR